MIKAAMFDTHPYDIESFEKSADGSGVSFKYFETKLNADTAGLAAGYDCAVAFVNDTLDAAAIDRLYENGVRLVALRCAGFNNVDVKAAYGKIHVVRVPAYSPEAVAEHAAALLLTSVRRIHKAYARTKDFNFSLNGLTGFNVCGKTVGVVGTGKIGRRFIKIMEGFGARVIASDPYPSDDGIEYVPLDELFARSDVISLHCPLTADTRYLIRRETIAKMKKGVVIINTSRGGLIESEDLLAAIKEKQVGAACLDVYEEESDLFFEDLSGHIMKDDVLARLLTMPNVLLTSHQGFLTEEALAAIADETVGNIKAFFERGEVRNEVCYRCGSENECKNGRRSGCF